MGYRSASNVLNCLMKSLWWKRCLVFYIFKKKGVYRLVYSVMTIFTISEPQKKDTLTFVDISHPQPTNLSGATRQLPPDLCRGDRGLTIVANVVYTSNIIKHGLENGMLILNHTFIFGCVADHKCFYPLRGPVSLCLVQRWWNYEPCPHIYK